MTFCPQSGKQVFASKGEAHRAVACLCKRRDTKPLAWAKGRLTAYPCRACKGFHVGHGLPQ